MLSELRSLDRTDRRLVFEAASLMAATWMALRLVGFPVVRRMLGCYIAASRNRRLREPPAAIGPVRWAIAAVAARCRPATCLIQALAADAMLRRRGVPCELRIGVRPRGEGAVPVEAHAWVECAGAVAVGAIDGLSSFKVLHAPPGR